MQSAINKLLADAHINPKSFEADLGVLCHKWITLKGLDEVIDGLDTYVQALEERRDLELAAVAEATGPTPSRT